MATGGVESGKPPFEAGASQRDTDYLHVIDWKKAAAAVKAGKAGKDQWFPGAQDCDQCFGRRAVFCT